MSDLALAAPSLRSPAAEFWRRFRRKHVAVVAGCVLLAMIFAAIAAPWIAPYGPATPDYDNVLAGPSWQHVCGTDTFGRDERRRDVQHVVGHADPLTLVVATDGLEDRGLGLSINGDQVVLVLHIDAVALGNLGTLASEKRHPEDHWSMDKIREIDVGSDARAL